MILTIVVSRTTEDPHVHIIIDELSEAATQLRCAGDPRGAPCRPRHRGRALAAACKRACRSRPVRAAWAPSDARRGRRVAVGRSRQHHGRSRGRSESPRISGFVLCRTLRLSSPLYDAAWLSLNKVYTHSLTPVAELILTSCCYLLIPL